MLSTFDWIRRTRDGAELLAILQCLAEDPETFDKIGQSLLVNRGEPGPPPTALTLPCARCWIYPRAPERPLCLFCQTIRERSHGLETLSRQSLVLWGFVNWLPRSLRFAQGQALRRETGFQSEHILGAYLYDANHFLVMIRRLELQPWLREMVLHHGADLKGHLQIFPTTSARHGIEMGEILCRAVHHDARFPMDKLRIRFYIRPYQILQPHKMDREGLLTFEISEFLSLLEMATIFRSVVYPEEQKMLYELLTMEDTSEEMFYWGRFSGVLNQEARDLLDAWKVRTWPRNRVKFFYEMMSYVRYQSSY